MYELGSATAAEVLEKLPDPPSYSAVRAMLRVLEQKGIVRHEQDGPRYLYRAIVGRETASRSALKQMVRTFFCRFGGSGSSGFVGYVTVKTVSGRIGSDR